MLNFWSKKKIHGVKTDFSAFTQTAPAPEKTYHKHPTLAQSAQQYQQEKIFY